MRTEACNTACISTMPRYNHKISLPRKQHFSFPKVRSATRKRLKSEKNIDYSITGNKSVVNIRVYIACNHWQHLTRATSSEENLCNADSRGNEAFNVNTSMLFLKVFTVVWDSLKMALHPLFSFVHFGDKFCSQMWVPVTTSVVNPYSGYPWFFQSLRMVHKHFLKTCTHLCNDPILCDN